jgi:hypothetical protein
MVRPLGLRVPLTVGLCYRPAICPGHLIMMPLSAEPRGGSQCLRADGELWYPWGHERVSLVRCSREITGQRTRRALGPRWWQNTKTRGRLAALGVPALEAVWHRRQEECLTHLLGGLVGASTGYSYIFILIFIIILLLSQHILSSSVLPSFSFYPHIYILPLPTRS